MGYFIALFILLIIASLAAAGFFMLKRPQDDAASNAANNNAKRSMAKALTFRIGLSVVLFLCVLISYKLGWIAPTGLPLKSAP